VGVQIRVPASAVAVGERGGDQPGDVGLPNPFLPCRVKNAWRSMKLSASCTAAQCASFDCRRYAR